MLRLASSKRYQLTDTPWTADLRGYAAGCSPVLKTVMFFQPWLYHGTSHPLRRYRVEQRHAPTGWNMRSIASTAPQIPLQHVMHGLEFAYAFPTPGMIRG